MSGSPSSRRWRPCASGWATDVATYVVQVTNLKTGDTVEVIKRTTDEEQARYLARRYVRSKLAGWNGALRLKATAR